MAARSRRRGFSGGVARPLAKVVVLGVDSRELGTHGRDRAPFFPPGRVARMGYLGEHHMPSAFTRAHGALLGAMAGEIVARSPGRSQSLLDQDLEDALGAGDAHDVVCHDPPSVDNIVTAMRSWSSIPKTYLWPPTMWG